jgi:hypothetical protein
MGDMRLALACAATGVVLFAASAANADRVLTPSTVNARMRACLLNAGASRVVLRPRQAQGDTWFTTMRPSPLPGRRAIAADVEHAGWSIVYETKRPHDVVGILSVDDGLSPTDGAAFVRCTNAALR